MTASITTDGEDELAGTGLSLVIDGFNHLQITTRLLPAPELGAQALVARLRSGPDLRAQLKGGTFRPGNVANPRAPVITAAGEGSVVAIAINADLVDDDVRTAVQDSNRGSLTGAPDPLPPIPTTPIRHLPGVRCPRTPRPRRRRRSPRRPSTNCR